MKPVLSPTAMVSIGAAASLTASAVGSPSGHLGPNRRCALSGASGGGGGGAPSAGGLSAASLAPSQTLTIAVDTPGSSTPTATRYWCCRTWRSGCACVGWG
jgi:hypothetical protein